MFADLGIIGRKGEIMRRITRVLAGFLLGAGMFVSLGDTAMASTYTLSEILAEVHQDERFTSPHYYFEGGDEIANRILPQTGAGPYFAPGDRIVSDIPGVYLLTFNPEMDNIRKLRAVIADGYGTYNRMDGLVGETIGEGAPLLISAYRWNGDLDTFTEGSEQGLFQSMHIVSQEDELAVRLLSNDYYDYDKPGFTLPKSYRGYYIREVYSEQGTVIAYNIHFMTYDNTEPNAQQYYAEKAALRNVGQVQTPAQTGEEHFDAAYYAANNPDIVAIIGSDPEALWQHYRTFGCVEGRKAHP